jgi:hypothetical protein
MRSEGKFRASVGLGAAIPRVSALQKELSCYADGAVAPRFVSFGDISGWQDSATFLVSKCSVVHGEIR